MKKHKVWPWSSVTVLIGVLIALPAVHAQTVDGQAAAALQQQQLAQEATQKESLAESIIGQQEVVSGRAFDPSFRAEAKRRLADRSVTELQETLSVQGGLGPLSPGASQNDLVYTPVFPCRVIDTRVPGAGGPLLSGVQRDFDVVGVGFAGQGGVAGSCGIPFGPATAVVINFVAVNAFGAGNLRVWPFGGAVPNASIINYSPVQNIANGVVVQICDPAVSACGKDISVIADVNGTQLVADVLGFFQNFKPDTFRRNTNTFVTIPGIAGPPVVMTTVSFIPNFTGNALARARGYCNMDGAAAVHRINIAIGTTATDAFGASVSEWGVLALNAPQPASPRSCIRPKGSSP